ncbi:proline dehydrogenase [Saccharothrix sp. Mg75]|uniref:proline dehydrogenase n=1 Tax=Saccharothrix sp. Mg75 TaxID=3445357 RepID=UPI003EEBC25A
MNPLRTSVLAAADSDALRRFVTTAPVSRDVVRWFVAGGTAADAVDVTGELVDRGLRVALDHPGPGGVRPLLELPDRLRAVGLAADAEVDVRLSSLDGSPDDALDQVARVCAAAERAGTSVTLDPGDLDVDAALRLLAELRRTWPGTGVVLRACLRRTPDDCRALADTRVRLRGGVGDGSPAAFGDPHEVALNYVRCANALLAGAGRPVFATHDPRLVEVVGERAKWYGRPPEGFEYLVRHGVRPAGQARLAAEGHVVRVHVPFGGGWYGHLARRLAERPADVASFLRSLVGRS